MFKLELKTCKWECALNNFQCCSSVISLKIPHFERPQKSGVWKNGMMLILTFFYISSSSPLLIVPVVLLLRLLWFFFTAKYFLPHIWIKLRSFIFISGFECYLIHAEIITCSVCANKWCRHFENTSWQIRSHEKSLSAWRAFI